MHTYIDGARRTPHVVSQSIPEYPFRALGDVTTCSYRRTYEVELAAFTPTASGAVDPLRPGFYLVAESEPELVPGQTRLARFTRTYSSVPLQHVRSSSTIYNRPAVPGSTILSASTTWDPPSVGASSSTTTNVTVDGALLGDTVRVSFSSLGSATATVSGVVSPAGNVLVTLQNTSSSSAIDLASGTLKVEVLRQARNYGLPATGNAGLFYQPDVDQESYSAYSRLSVVADEGVTNLPSGGTATLSFRGTSTAALAYNISAASLKTALEAVSTITAFGGVASVSGNYNDAAGFLVTLPDIATVTANAGSLTCSSAGSVQSSVVPVNNGYAQTITLAAAGSYPIASLTLVSGGSGFQQKNPTVVIYGGGGSGATASALATAGVYSLTLGSGGAGYTSAPTVSISGTGSGLVINVSAKFVAPSSSAATITGGGSGYAPTSGYAFNGNVALRNKTTGEMVNPGSFFQGVWVTNGVITLVQFGSYGATLDLPNDFEFVAINGATGSGGGCYLTSGGVRITGFVSAVTLVSGGSGFADPPSITLTGGGGSGATVSATLTTRTVTSVTLVNPGTGYTSTPSVSIYDGSGSGAIVNAVLTPGPAITGGTWSLSLFGHTPTFAYNASAADVQSTLDSLSGVQAHGGVVVGGSGFASTSISLSLAFTAPTLAGVSSLTPTPSAVTVSPVSGSAGRQQYVKFSAAQNRRLLTFSGAHGLVAGDKVYLKQGNSYRLERLDFAIVSSTQISLDPSLAPWSTSTAITEGGKYQGQYSPGPTPHRTRVTETYYLPGVTPGIASAADVPLQAAPVTDALYLNAVVRGDLFVVASDTDLDPWRDSAILKRTKVELQIPRA